MIEDLASHVRIERREPAGLAVLLRHQLLVESGDLDVKVELGEVEVRGEALGRVAVAVPVDLEGRRLVVPVDLVEVQELGELTFAVMGELDLFVGQSQVGNAGRIVRAVRYDYPSSTFRWSPSETYSTGSPTGRSSRNVPAS